MSENIEKAIKALIVKSENASDSSEALRFSQAALNIAHVSATLAGARNLERQP